MEWITATKLAERLGVTPLYIYRLTYREDAPVLRVGNDLRYKEPEFTNWLKTRNRARRESRQLSAATK